MATSRHEGGSWGEDFVLSKELQRVPSCGGAGRTAREFGSCWPGTLVSDTSLRVNLLLMVSSFNQERECM